MRGLRKRHRREADEAQARTVAELVATSPDEAVERVLASMEGSVPQSDLEDTELLLSAFIEQGVTCEFDYPDSMVRTVSPYELRETAQGVRLIGWDHDREGFRQFDPQKMIAVGLSPEAYRESEEA